MGKSGGASRSASSKAMKSVRERASSSRSRAKPTTDERTLEQHTVAELKAMAREQGVKVGRTKAETIANLRVTATPATPSRPTQEPERWTGHPMQHPVYVAIVKKSEPIAVMGKNGEPLTLVPHPTLSPDLVSFSIRTSSGREVAPKTTMGRFEFENFAQRLQLAPAGSPHYTPPKPRPMSTIERARYATSWSKTQVEAVREYVKSDMPYMRNVRISESTRSGQKTPRYLLTMHDREKGVTLRAHNWRDLSSYHETRNVMPDLPFRR